MYLIPLVFGAIAQLGERYTGSVEVSGSIPLGSTKFKARLIRAVAIQEVTLGWLFLCLGHAGVTIGQVNMTVSVQKSDPIFIG